MERMHEDAGTLGLVMNVLQPADRAANLSQSVRHKIREVRMRVAGSISAFATASAVGGVVPFGVVLITTPGILASMVYTLCRIMGQNQERVMAREMTVQLVRTRAQELGVEFVGMAAVEVFTSMAVALPGAGILALGALGAMGKITAIDLPPCWAKSRSNTSTWASVGVRKGRTK